MQLIILATAAVAAAGKVASRKLSAEDYDVRAGKQAPGGTCGLGIKCTKAAKCGGVDPTPENCMVICDADSTCTGFNWNTHPDELQTYGCKSRLPLTCRALSPPPSNTRG